MRSICEIKYEIVCEKADHGLPTCNKIQNQIDAEPGSDGPSVD